MSIQSAIQERIAQRQAVQEAQERAAALRVQMEIETAVAELRKRIGDLIPNDLQAAFTPLRLTDDQRGTYIETASGVLSQQVVIWVSELKQRGASGLRLGAQTKYPAQAYLLDDQPEQARRAAVLDMLADAAQSLANEAEAEAQHAAQRAAAEAEDAEAWPAFEAAKAAALAAADQVWPDGLELTLYRWRWCTAPASDTDAAEYEDAWSLHDTLRDGWLHRASINVPIRITEASLPTVERYTLRSAEDARNADLGWRNSIAVPGFEFYMFDGKRYLRRLEQEVIYLEDKRFVMVDWLKKLVQAAAQK